MGVYIGVFRSSQFRRDKLCDVWAHEAKDHLYHAGSMWARVVPSLGPHGVPRWLLLIFFYFLKKWCGKKVRSIWCPKAP
jgi:hypothetical protein